MKALWRTIRRVFDRCAASVPVMAVALVLSFTAACAHPASGTPPVPKPAQIKAGVDLGRAGLLLACGVGEADLVSATACVVVDLPIALVKEAVADLHSLDAILDGAKDGWQITLRTAWAEFKPRFDSVTNQKARLAINLITTVLDLL